MPNPFDQNADVIGRWVSDRQRLLRRETEDFLRSVILDYEPRQSAYWNRDYASSEKFEASVEPNLQRWREALGVFEYDGTPLDPVIDPWFEDENISVSWITMNVSPGNCGSVPSFASTSWMFPKPS